MIIKRTIPSYQLKLNPLRTSYYILSSTIPYTQPLPSILPPPHIIPTRHYSFLSLGFAFTSLALAPVECLSPYLITPPLLTLIVPFLVLSLSPLINYTRLSSPPYIKHHGYRPIRPAYISSHPIIKPHRYKQPVILPFILLLNFFFSPVFGSLP